MSEQTASKPFVQLHSKVEVDPKSGHITLTLGNCKHCVTTGKRPPVSQRALYHPENARDYDEQELQDVNADFLRRMAALGVVTLQSRFVPKNSMDRAPEPETTDR